MHASTYVLLLGGARSGKSTLAVSLAAEAGLPTWFIATAVALDADMVERIERPRSERPAEWNTIEESRDLVAALGKVPTADVLVIDCATTWIATLMTDGVEPDEILKSVDTVITLLVQRSGPTYVVSNEVGLGVHPPTQLGRDYEELLGWVNQRLAAKARRSLFLVAGRVLPLLDPRDVLA